MDSNTSSSGYFLNHENLNSVYYEGKEGDGIIDLGLSLRTLQPQAYHASAHGTDDYGDLIDWHELNPELKSSKMGHKRKTRESYDSETEGVQSKERGTYVKVNMDGVIVGRKICIHDHPGYSSLALQLEDMFGRVANPYLGYSHFKLGQNFPCFTKTQMGIGGQLVMFHGNCVKRLRIVPKNEAFVPSSSAFA
ncbi:Auxin-responsive protein IAA32 [Camellia lanceoleosa]|uniref:Auxin-responsive protein IAA32 n=1 Tax=Camellia lanceoleosa TaxID=1840588 RepID=A0ACC0IEU1_9ERIC|nr:Auxin-responsive protein IAA32 [Camellia lanceoleosa]